MGNKLKEFKELCEKCGAETRILVYVNRCDKTGFKGAHYECTCGHVSKTCNRVRNTPALK